MKKFAFPVLFLLFIAAGGTAGYYYNQVAKLEQNPQEAAGQEAATLVALVGKLIILPEGETPTVATVSDPEKLKDQPFFAQAKVGDKVLLYPNAKKAFLYDPVNNKILEAAPLNVDTGAQAKAPAKKSPPAEKETATSSPPSKKGE
jgi:hypothetical protein